MRLIYGGKDITKYIQNIDDITLDVGCEDNVYVYQLSNELIIVGEAAQEIRDDFFSECIAGLELTKDAVLVVDQCGIELPLSLVASGVKDCPEGCYVEINIQNIDADKRCYEELDRTVIESNGFYTSKKHPRIPYCIHKDDFTWHLLFGLRNSILAGIGVLVAIVNAATFGIFGDDIQDGINDIYPDSWDRFFTGCGHYTIAPLVRDIFTFHAGNCGLEFKSSIFNNPNNPHYNTALWCQKDEKGFPKENEDPNLTDPTSFFPPLVTITELLDDLKKAFPNTDYKIVDGCLYFEDKGFFSRCNNIIENIVELSKQVKLNPCYTYPNEEICAYTDYSSCRDSRDAEGNRRIKKYSVIKGFYDDGLRPPDNVKGDCTIESPFAPARFMFDESSHLASGLFGNGFIFGEFTNMIDRFRACKSTNIGVFPVPPNLSNCCQTNALLIENHTVDKCKLIVLEDNFDPCNALPQRIPLADNDGCTYYHYNTPMYYGEYIARFEAPYIPDPSTEIVITTTYTLTDGSEFVDTRTVYRNELGLFDNVCRLNPVTRGDVMAMDDLEIPIDCDSMTTLLTKKLGNCIETHYGTAFVGTWTINFKSCTATAKNIKVNCN